MCVVFDTLIKEGRAAADQPKVLEKVKRIQEQIELLPNAVRHNILSLAARKVKQVQGGEDGMIVRPMVDKVPQTPEEMARLRAVVASMPVYINALVSPDNKAGRSAASRGCCCRCSPASSA